MIVERVYKVKEGRPNAVDLIKGERIQLVVNTPRGQDTHFDEKAYPPRRGDGAHSDHHYYRCCAGGGRWNCRHAKAPTTVFALQQLHAETAARQAESAPGTRCPANREEFRLDARRRVCDRSVVLAQPKFRAHR